MGWVSGIPHPYFTADLPGVGGSIKGQPQDFLVEEVPLYTPCGRGEHVFFALEKENLSTLEAVERLSRRLGIEGKEFGYAGLKDRKGVTRQVFSISRVEPAEIEALDIPQVRVLWAKRHTNKLRVGHLRGNLFRVWIRDVAAGVEAKLEAVLTVISRLGIPNYFGFQRFGNRGNAHLIGRAFLRGDDSWAIRRILGYPSGAENNPNIVRARECFMAGDWKGAYEAYPPSYREEKKLLSYLLQAGENYTGARSRLDLTARKLYSSAYQSYLFNLALTERLRRVGPDPGRLHPGDLALLHRNGAVFRVEDLEAEAPRAATFEISPTGPIFGMKMPVPGGLQAEIERELLGREGLRLEDFHQLMPKLRLEGGRRPFRVAVESLSWRLEGADLHLEFFLPKGSYATCLLREIMKNEAVPDGFYEEGEVEKHGLWSPVLA
jgi:tRNA pseudouridine13 synthase